MPVKGRRWKILATFFSCAAVSSTEVNRLDVELVNFARDEFRSKYGMKCQEMP